MPEISTPIEVGFAEFSAKLISEVFSAIIASQFQQEKEHAELIAEASLSLEEYARRAIKDEQLDEELSQVFPGTKPDQVTSVFVGAPYQPEKKGVTEEPPIFSVLGLKLVKGDYGVKRKIVLLTASGVEKIRTTLQTQLAKQQHDAINALVRRGLPRVIADAGRVNAKLTYEMTEVDEVPTGAAKRPLPIAEALIPTGQSMRIATSGMLPKMRLMVRPADERAPQNQQLQVNVFGEVEISFKTIT